MPKSSALKVIIDTNVCIGLLIGKRIQSLRSLFSFAQVTIVYSADLLEEIKAVTSRAKFIKYFDQTKLDQFIDLLTRVGEEYSIVQITPRFSDPKDDFLLALIEESGADYLVTGDKALLNLVQFADTAIVGAREFDKILYSERVNYCIRIEYSQFSMNKIRQSCTINPRSFSTPVCLL